MSDKKKAETIFRTFRTIVIKAGDEEGVIDILIPMSTASTDRHSESIDPKGWKKSLKEFKKRSILLSSHNYGSLQNQIGELLDLQITEEGLFASPKYYINQGNPEADWAFFLASKGMAAFSVGFIPIKWEDSDGKDGKPTRTFIEQELIEISQVTVPSNRDAIMGLQAKGVDDPVVKEIMDEVLITLKAKYDCSCIDCGHEMSTDKHCKEVKCPKCGGTMRRVERPGPGEETNMLADSNKSNKIADDIKKKVLDTPVVIEEIDEEKLKASMAKEEKEDKLKEIGLFDVNELYEIVKENKELKEILKDIELKAGAVLNAKNKSNLKNAQDLIQSVLDSAGAEEGLEEGDKETKDTKKDDTVITITDDKKEDSGKDEKTEEKTITIDDKVLSEAISKAMNYTLGITDK